MKLKIRPLDIPEDNPFRFDALNRRESAEILTQLISSLDEPSVIAIDAPWGHGKTTFVRMLRHHIVNKGFQTLYFNAWENDFVDDALSTLIGEIELGIKELELGKDEKSKIKKSVGKIKGLGSYLVKKSVPLLVSSATGGIVNSDAIAKLTESIAREQIDNYEKAKSTFKSFKNTLKEFIEILQKDNDKPVVFFIDELDRCRPTFAIEILEKAKHLFSVPGFVFVIAIDKEQIGHSIRSIYGQGMEIDGYLRRFIDFDYRLPPANSIEYSAFLFNRFELNDYFRKHHSEDAAYAEEIYSDIFGKLSNIFGFSLRKQEQCFSMLSIALLTTPTNHKLFPHYFIFLLVLKAANLLLYRNFVEGNADIFDIMKFIKSTERPNDFLTEHYGAVIEAYLAVGNGERDLNQKNIKYYESIMNDESNDQNVRDRASKVINNISSIRSGDSFNITNYLARKIDMLDRFIDVPHGE